VYAVSRLRRDSLCKQEDKGGEKVTSGLLAVTSCRMCNTCTERGSPMVSGKIDELNKSILCIQVRIYRFQQDS